MGMPNIPNITPTIILKREEVINLLLTSIALEEIGLSHIINAEGEKLQRIIEQQDLCLEDALRINYSVLLMMRTVAKNQMLLQFKLEDVLKLEEEQHFKGDCFDE